jgi:tetratricopeptide (TPR) repeat protein
LVSDLQHSEDNLGDDSCSNDSLERALNLLSKHGLEGAASLVERVLQEDPDSWEAWAAKADILYFLGQHSESLECCERSLRIEPENALAWNTKGNALYGLDRYEEAINCYSMAIKAEPLFIRAWMNKKMALEVLLRRSSPRVRGIKRDVRERDVRR